MKPEELFSSTVADILGFVPAEQRHGVQLEIAALFAELPEGDRTLLGKQLGPKLKAIKARYIKKTEADEVSPADQADRLRAAGVITPWMSGVLRKTSWASPVRDAYGQLLAYERTGDRTLLVMAYTQLQGFLMEQLRIQASPLVTDSISMADRPHYVRFRGLREGRVAEMGAEVQNDVPVIHGHIWETKYSTRRAYGDTHQAVNQVLKYQAAVDQGVYTAATIEVTGNIDPSFLQALCEGREVAVGLELFAPDVELLYATPEGGTVVLKSSRHASLRVRRLGDVAIEEALRRAIHERRYEVFGQRVLREGIAQFAAAVVDGYVDPTLITDLDDFRVYEVLAWNARLEAAQKGA